LQSESIKLPAATTETRGAETYSCQSEEFLLLENVLPMVINRHSSF